MAKLDIFEVLDHITMKDTGWFQYLPADKQKAFQPVVVQKWVRGANNNADHHILATNEFVNPFIFSLSAHPVLIYKLFCAANGLKTPTRYRYLKPAKPPTKRPLSLKAIREFYELPFKKPWKI